MTRQLRFLLYTKLLALFVLGSNIVCAIAVYALAPEPLVVEGTVVSAAIAAEIARQASVNTAANYQLANLVVSSVGAVLVAYFSSKQVALLREVKAGTDGLTTKLVASEKIVSKQEGKQEGVTEEKARQTAVGGTNA